jgi:ABC-type uncharacterized transport system auxiliary subunit
MKALRNGKTIRLRLYFGVSLFFGTIASLAPALAGCGATRPIQYYALDAPAVRGPAGSSAKPMPVTLIVGHITASHLYREDKLVYRTGSNELRTYEYHRWSEPPTEIIENMLLGQLRGSGRYQAVQLQRSNVRGDFVLRGRLEEMVELTAPQEGARAGLEMELFDAKKGSSVWAHSYREEEAVQGKGVDAVVSALNRAVLRIVRRVSADLDGHFAERPPQ